LKITDITCYAVDATYKEMPQMPRNFTIVEIGTDEGIVGIGDCTNWPVGDSLPHVVKELGQYIIGQDPFNIEKLWQDMYRASNYVGLAGLAVTAISGIEIALWDIVGKALNVPVYKLIGGRCRDRIKCYANYWTMGMEPSAYAEAAKQVVAEGYGALKFYAVPGQPAGDSLSRSYDLQQIKQLSRLVGAVREAVGPEVEVFVECGGKLDFYTAERVLYSLRGYEVGFVEEPIPPSNMEAMAKLRALGHAPIASGERLFTAYDFRRLLELQAVSVIQPDIVRTGGISEMKKIAAIAEAYYTPVAPHNSNSPVSTVAGLHFAASTPNFLIMEHFTIDVAWRDIMITPALKVVDGYMELPEKPGLGIEVDTAFLRNRSKLTVTL
jgi:galactonate dehydratase